MSMSHAFNDIFNEKKKARSCYQKAKQLTGRQDYQELEASAYWHILEQKLKDNPLLAAFKIVLAPNGTVTSEQLDGSIREDKLSEAENAQELLQLTNGLLGLAHFKTLGKRHARVRFIAGILEACYIALNANDVDKAAHWHTLKDILESVKDSHLSDTWAVADRARNFVGASQSLTHYKTQLVASVATVEQIILKEHIIQTKQAIKDDLRKLTNAMRQIPIVLPRFIYNAYAVAPITTLDYHFLHLDQPEQITSLVTVGIQQIMGLPNPANSLCYEHGELNKRGLQINRLNHIITLLGGKNDVKMNGLASELPNAEESVLFLKTLRERAQDGRLMLDREGSIILFDTTPDAGHSRERCRFPSGFSPDILHADKDKQDPKGAEKQRQKALLDYIELLTRIQELQNCFQLNQNYAHYLSQVGELGAFAMTDPTLHEQMERHNKEVAYSLQTKMEEMLTALAASAEGALDANSLAKSSEGSLRRQAIKEARNVIQHTKRKAAAIAHHSDAISHKRKETMQQMKDKKISFYSSIQQLIQQFNDFRRLQNLLGKDVPALSSDVIRDMNDKARRLDDAIDAIRPPSISTTPIAVSRDHEEKEEEKKEEKEEKEAYPSVTRSPSHVWVYHTVKKKWQYKGLSQFKTARQYLQYDQTATPEEARYDPAILLQAYLPKTAPQAQKRKESLFDYHIRIRYDIAAALKNTIVYPLSLTKVSIRNHGRAARFVLCKEMLAVFEYTVNHELLSEAAIKKMSDQLAAHFKAQEELFNGSFNRALKQLQFNLTLSTQHAMLTHASLLKIDTWIESGVKKTCLEENLAEIEKQAAQLNRLHDYSLLTIKTRQKLDAYATHLKQAIENRDRELALKQAQRQAKAIQSTIKRKSGIQFTATPVLNAKEEHEGFFNEVLALIDTEKKMPCPSEEAMANKIIEAIETRVKAHGGEMNHSKFVQQYAYQIIALLPIYTAAEAYDKDPAYSNRQALILTIENAIHAVENDQGEEKFGVLTLQEGYGKIVQTLLQIVYVPLTHRQEKKSLSDLFHRLEKCIEVQQLKKIEAAEAKEHRVAHKQLKKESLAEVDAIQLALEPYARALESSQSHFFFSSLASVYSAALLYRTAFAVRKQFIDEVIKAITAAIGTDDSREEGGSPARVYRNALQKVVCTLLDSPLVIGKERMDIVALSDQLDAHIITLKQQKEAEIYAAEQQAEAQLQRLEIPRWPQTIHPITLARTMPQNLKKDTSEEMPVTQAEAHSCPHLSH